MKNTKQILKNVFTKATEILSEAAREFIPSLFGGIAIAFFAKLIVTEQNTKTALTVALASFSVASVFLNQAILRVRLDALFRAFMKNHEFEKAICEHAGMLNERIEKLESLIEDLQNNAD